MTGSYRVPAQRTRAEFEVKKSRFICTIDYIESEQQGKEIRRQLQQEFPSANHHCWAQQLGSPQSVHQACSDDGEPHGTAGKPILNQLHHAHLLQAQAVVTRLFGGIKLGTGGLVRAYSDAVALALDSLESQPLIEWQSIQLGFSYDLEPQIRQHLAETLIRREEWHYSEQVDLSCQVATAQVEQFRSTLRDLSGGRVVFELVE